MTKKELKSKFTISMDAELLRRLDQVCEARQQARSQIIERLVKNQIDEEEEFVSDMENPVLRTVLGAMVNTPGLMHMMAKVLGQKLTDEELERIRVAAKEQVDQGKERQQLKKGQKTQVGKIEPV